MNKKSAFPTDRARRLLAQEAARIICEQGIQDYRTAKIKAAQRLGMSTRGSLPGNSEIEQAVADHLLLFGGESHLALIAALRRAAVAAMELLSAFTPRLVGPVLAGTAGESSAINLHVFTDSPEQVAFLLEQDRLPYRTYERRLKSRRGHAENFAGYRFALSDADVEATVFPYDGIRQAPISPIDGRPMRRADTHAVRDLLEEVGAA